MIRKTLPFAAALLLAAGCGGDDTSQEPEGQGDQSGAGAVTEDSGQQSSAGGGPRIAMKDIQFAPKEATAKVGQEVVWTNEDGVQHDVEAEDGSFDSELFGQGGTYRYTPEKAGDFKYVCTVHPGMEGTLTVTD